MSDRPSRPGDSTSKGPNASPNPYGTQLIVLTAQLAPGKANRRVFRLHKERVVIGSVISADARITGEGIAPLHAVIEAYPVPTLYDLASETGVFVNDEKVVMHPLKAGDRITIGKVTFEFALEDAAEVAKREKHRESGSGQKLFMNPQEDLAPLLLQSEEKVQEIFDYRPTHGKKALEVVMSWRGTILNVRHFVARSRVSIGNTQKCDFGIPPILNTKIHTLATKTEEGAILHLDPKMQGIVQSQGALRSAGRAGEQVALGQNDFAKLSVGEIDFYISFTASPPHLKRNRLLQSDPFFFKIMFTSLVLSVGIIYSMLNASVPANLEAEQLPERIATILYQPEKFVSQPKPEEYRRPPVQKTPAVKPMPAFQPKPAATTKIAIQPKEQPPKIVPKEMQVRPQPTAKAKVAERAQQKGGQSQAQGHEGEGARAKGKEGSRGKPNAAPSDTHQTAAKRPSPQAGSGRGAGNSQVPDEGNVDLLKGASSKIQDLLGNSAAQLGKGGSKIAGFGGFNTQGSDGLAISGEGRGGGGNAAGLGGLSDKGRGGGRVGVGLGAAGDGNGIIGGKSRVVIKTGGPEEAVVMGSIDRDAVEAALMAHRDEFRLCYEKEINAENPRLAGRVGTTFVIGSSGRVSEAGIESTTLKNANVERCILRVIKRIEFPLPSGAGIVQVSYPFKYSAAGTK